MIIVLAVVIITATFGLLAECGKSNSLNKTSTPVDLKYPPWRCAEWGTGRHEMLSLQESWKKKLEPQEIYLMCLRQILDNQRSLLILARSGDGCHLANESKDLIKRIDYFLEKGE